MFMSTIELARARGAELIAEAEREHAATTLRRARRPRHARPRRAVAGSGA